MKNFIPLISVILTCFNRKDITLECLNALFSSKSIDKEYRLSIFLVDDCSTDGTAAAVSASYPQVTVITGSGSFFWAKGMHRAQEEAEKINPDYLLWLNDDTILNPEAIIQLLAVNVRGNDSENIGVVIVGATTDASYGRLTYGGLRSKSRLRRFNYDRLPISNFPQSCEAMNGNIVLVPREIFSSVGSIDPTFEHAMGDIDYALRVRSAGFRIVQAPGTLGKCSENRPNGSFHDKSLSASIRWNKFIDRKGLPPASWRHFVKRHGGIFWPAYFSYPYANFLLRIWLNDILKRFHSAPKIDKN